MKFNINIFNNNKCCFVSDLFVPKTKRNVAYIVCGVLFDEAGQVLMMQEAKRSCYGHWYLPAGRMEPNETIRVDKNKIEQYSRY